MARLLKSLDPTISQYRDRRFEGSQEAFELALRTSTTVYVGNLSFFTTEEQIYEVFSKVGDVKRIVMGLDKVSLTPCGFCFVVYYTRADTEDCVKYINGMTLDDRPVRADFDWGFKEGRQFGRGRSGGQVRDEYRMDFDDGRGGYGQIFRQELETRRAAIQHQQRQLSQGQDAADTPPVKRQRTQGGETQQEAQPESGGGGGRRRESDDEDDDDAS